MNWYKAKTILIIFLVVVNIAFFTYIIYDSFQSKKTESTVFNTVIELLDKNNISIDNTVIEKTDLPQSAKSVYAENIISSYDDFAKLLLGENVTKTNEGVYTSESGNATLTFDGDKFEAVVKPGYMLMQSDSNTEPIKTAKKFLTAVGIDISDVKYDITGENGQTIINFYQQANKYPVFGAGITIITDNGTITSAKGCWFVPKNKNHQNNELKNISGVLIDYMNIRQPLSEQCTITDISFGYAMHETDQYHNEIILTPSWQITDNTGKKELLDAREKL